MRRKRTDPMNPGQDKRRTNQHANQQAEGTRMSTVRAENLSRMAVEIPLQPASYDIWDKKYRLKTKQGAPVDVTIDDTYQRVAHALAEVESTPELREHWYERFLWALRRGAIPAGRITSNAGAREHKPKKIGRASCRERV